MKRIFVLAFIILMSFPLFSCKEEQTPISKTPEVQEEITLPTEDKGTKEIVIPFPDDFTFGYTEPEIVAPEDFDWGEYMPFVRYSVGSYGEVGSPVYTYAFLGEGIKNIDEGHELYEKLNSKYKKTFEYSLDDTIDAFPLSMQEDAIPLASESRVIWISTDADVIGNYYLEKSGIRGSYTNGDGTVWDIHDWNGKYDVYEKEELASTHILENTFYYDDGGFLHSYTGAYTPPENIENTSFNDIHNNSYATISRLSEETYGIYSSGETLLYKITFDFDTAPIGRNYRINQIIDVRYLVITFYSDMITEEACHNVYLFDLETEKLSKINGYSFNPLISPDRKFLIYSRETWRSTEVNSRINREYDLKNGFYIKNIETGETTFYEYNAEQYSSSTQSINWVNEEKLKALIN